MNVRGGDFANVSSYVGGTVNAAHCIALGMKQLTLDLRSCHMITRAGWRISLEVRGGDERHREFADPFRRSESQWSVTEYSMARLFHDRLSESEAVGSSRRILRLRCDIEVDWASFSYPVTSASPDGRQLAVFG